MSDDLDDYDVFLLSWEPSARLEYAVLPQNLEDPLVRDRLFRDSSGKADVERAAFAAGLKTMADDELNARAYSFFEDNHEAWATHFEDLVLTQGVPQAKFDIYTDSFVNHWVDGRKRRQDSSEMLAIKASIRDLDHNRFKSRVDAWVIHPVPPTATALFTLDEMAVIFDANDRLIDAFMPDYVDHLENAGPSVASDLWVRRGVYMPTLPTDRRELHYLSSYSLALGPVEQFAQTYTPATKGKGVACIFSALLPAIQDRVVAFAPFVKGMDLRQLEIVVAPPTARTPLQDHGDHGGIREFSFR